ncbi:hypothetical protein ACLQ24_25115 [Micromonospora sp. DT4]|uniref:hypothetical protein n=1 Tax=Micromonospora sp. DT4 TaxID=3393438 RepID=UPI003CEF2909
MSYDRFVEVVADIATNLPADHVTAWAGVLMGLDKPGNSATAAELIGARPGFSVGTHWNG